MFDLIRFENEFKPMIDIVRKYIAGGQELISFGCMNDDEESEQYQAFLRIADDSDLIHIIYFGKDFCQEFLTRKYLLEDAILNY